MIDKRLINRLILPVVIAISLFVPAIASSPTFAMSSMRDMDHAPVDLVSCINQHQSPAAPTVKELDQLKHEDDDPAPRESAYFIGLFSYYPEPKKQKTILITSSSFRPPDIVIRTANLRI